MNKCGSLKFKDTSSASDLMRKSPKGFSKHWDSHWTGRVEKKQITVQRHLCWKIPLSITCFYHRKIEVNTNDPFEWQSKPPTGQMKVDSRLPRCSVCKAHTVLVMVFNGTVNTFTSEGAWGNAAFPRDWQVFNTCVEEITPEGWYTEEPW